MVGHPCEPFPTMELRDRAAEADWALHYGNTREIMDALARLEEDFDQYEAAPRLERRQARRRI